MMKQASMIAATAGMALASWSGAALIDFETLPDGSAPMDDQNLTDAYNVAEFNFVTFEVLRGEGAMPTFFEASGTDDIDGFVNVAEGENDVETLGGEGLGSFFLRDDRDVRATGGPLSLLITFTRAGGPGSVIAPTVASGEIWDIDGVSNPDARSFGTEQWEVWVTDILGNRELAATSPEGTESTGPLDGLPWAWGVLDEDGIASIELKFIGTKQNGLGVAFDNFSSNGVIPTPGAAAIAGLAGLAMVRRRR